MSSRVTQFRATLARRPLLGDGATGTQLQQLGLAPGACGEFWNTDQPDRVRQVHRSYLAAGSDLLTTNTFGGTSLVLAGRGAAARAHELTVTQALAAALAAGADVVGANCGTELSLDAYIKLTAELTAAAAGRPVLVQPNAGSPRFVDGQICYDEAAAQFAAAAPHFITAGARFVGGCCGSTPAHLAAMATHFPK